MKLQVLTKEFRESISAADYREKFDKWMGNRNHENMPTLFVDLFESKTPTQLGTIFRDFGIIARLMHTDKDTIYAESMRHPELQEFFLEESEFGIGKHRKTCVKLHTLSQFSKDECIQFIPMYREVWHGVINEQYGEFVVIHWSKSENISKPDFERLS